MANFSDVKIGQTFYTTQGTPSKKISESDAVSLVPEYCGVDWQDVEYNVEFSQRSMDHVYGISKPELINGNWS